MNAAEYLSIFYIKKCELQGIAPTQQSFFPPQYRDPDRSRSTRTEFYRRTKENYVLEKDEAGLLKLFRTKPEERFFNQIVDGIGTCGLFSELPLCFLCLFNFLF
jgi:hypothetical protein